MNFFNLMKKSEKKNYRIISKRLIFGQTYREFGCRGNVKSDGHTIDISKFLQRMMEQRLEISAP